MDKKKLGIIIPVFVIIALVFAFSPSDNSPDENIEKTQISTQLTNESIGLVIILLPHQ